MTDLANILAPLNEQQRIYVECQLKGMTKTASVTAAGYISPRAAVERMSRNEAVRRALVDARQVFANEVDFSRRKAHDMLMDAHRCAANSIEQVTAIRELIKLHGVAAIEKKQILHTHDGDVRLTNMSDEDLVKLAGFDNMLDVEYHEVKREPACLPANDADTQ